MSRPSWVASALLANSTSPGSLSAVISGASALASPCQYLPQIAGSVCAFASYPSKRPHGDSFAVNLAAPCLPTSSGQATGLPTVSASGHASASVQGTGCLVGASCASGRGPNSLADTTTGIRPAPSAARGSIRWLSLRPTGSWELAGRVVREAAVGAAADSSCNVAGDIDHPSTSTGLLGQCPYDCSTNSSASSSHSSSSCSSSSSGIWVSRARFGSRGRRHMLCRAVSGYLLPSARHVHTSPLCSTQLVALSSRAALRTSDDLSARQAPSHTLPPPPPAAASPSAASSAVPALGRRLRQRGGQDPAAAASASVAMPTAPPARGRPRKAPAPAAASLQPSPTAAVGATPPLNTVMGTKDSPLLAAASCKSEGVAVRPVRASGAGTSPTVAAAAPAASGGSGSGGGGRRGLAYVEFRDVGESYYSSVIFQGDVQAWHQQHLDELRTAPVRGPDVPLPSLEQFERQVDVEIQARHLALEEYRRELDKQKARGALEESVGVRRLLDVWIPTLAGLIEQHTEQFMKLQGSWRAASDRRDRPLLSRSTIARARTVGVPSAEEAVRKVELQRQQQQTGGDSSSTSAAAGNTSSSSSLGGGGGLSVTDRDYCSSLESPLMCELADWVPHVLPVPPQVLARTVLSSLLNDTILGVGHNNEMPSGMTRSTDAAEHIGERLVHTVSYMKVCEAIVRKRKELFAEGRRLRAARREGSLAAEAEVLQGKAAAAAAKQAADRDVDASSGSSGGGGGGGGGGDGIRWKLDAQIVEAAARVRAARKALEDLKAAAAAVQPSSAARELAGASVVKAGGGADAGRYKTNRTRQLKKLAAEVPGLATGMSEWSLETRVKVGASLLALAVTCLRVRVPGGGGGGGAGSGDDGSGGGGVWLEEAAFTHTTNALMTFERGGYQTPGVIICHPQVLRLLEGDEELRRLLQPRVLPMLVEPRPWNSLRGGGLTTTTVPIVKTRDSPLLLTRLKQAHRKGRMQELYDALTVLGNVPWRVNARLFAVMEQVVNSGGGELGFPSTKAHDLPPRFTTALNSVVQAYLEDATPEQCGTPYMRLQREGFRRGQLLVGSGAFSPGEEEAYQRQCDDVRMANRNESGQRTVLKYRLETARQLVGAYNQSGRPDGPAAAAAATTSAPAPTSSEELSTLMLPTYDIRSEEPTTFFQPHNIDFRGRAYPLHPFLNQLGDDATRGLLQFGVGRPLGERGFQWLLIQLANLWGRGVDKLPLSERLAWAERMLPAVRASAAAPLEGGGGAWWRGGERPWQLLATCFEVAAALEAPGGPAAYVSHQPVNQDGTCNGLQHYAALARDSGCGAAVNLLPADQPQDVYQAVAEAVADRVARDRRLGRSEAAKAYGNVDRKLVKQTVMTYVYGVTIVGAREQIDSRLEERGWSNARERRKVAMYLAHVVFASMGEVFGPVVAVRSWLDDCAKFAVSTGHPVSWTSPLGFPIEQPYRKLRTYQVWTPLQKITLRDYRNEEDAPVDVRRQRNGFPPNYIHSLDSAHMMLTALAVRRAGGMFAAVHDSFWTHATTVDDMNCKIRDTFIQLHSRPLLRELRDEVSRNPLYRCARLQLPLLPPAGDLDLEPIRYSTYFFS